MYVLSYTTQLYEIAPGNNISIIVPIEYKENYGRIIWSVQGTNSDFGYGASYSNVYQVSLTEASTQMTVGMRNLSSVTTIKVAVFVRVLYIKSMFYTDIMQQ